MINQCYPLIFYSEFPMKTLTHNNLNYKQLFGQTSQTITAEGGYKQTKPANLPIFSYLKTCTTNTTKSLKRNTIRKMIPVYNLNFTNISINHPSVTTFINCVYRFQENIIAYINILACYKTTIIESMLKNVNLSYVAQNHLSVTILKYLLYR